MLIGGTYICILYTYDISAEKSGIILLGLVKIRLFCMVKICTVRIILTGGNLHNADYFALRRLFASLVKAWSR